MSTEPTDPGDPTPSGTPAAPPATATPAPQRPPGLRSAAGLAVIGGLGVFVVVILALIWVAADHMHPPATPLDGPSNSAGQSNS